MRTLCVAVVVLSLTSVCQPAPLDAEKSEDQVSNVTGTWYGIAMAADPCFFMAYTAFLILPSTKYEIFPADTQNIYTYKVNVKLYGHCVNSTGRVFYDHNKVFSDDFESRRQNISADQLEKFRTQAAAFGLTNIHTMSSNYDYENCIAFYPGDAVDPTALGITYSIVGKLESTFRECVIKKLPHTKENYDFRKHLGASLAGHY